MTPFDQTLIAAVMAAYPVGEPANFDTQAAKIAIMRGLNEDHERVVLRATPNGLSVAFDAMDLLANDAGRVIVRTDGLNVIRIEFQDFKLIGARRLEPAPIKREI